MRKSKNDYVKTAEALVTLATRGRKSHINIKDFLTLKTNFYSSIRSNYTNIKCHNIKLILDEYYRIYYADISN